MSDRNDAEQLAYLNGMVNSLTVVIKAFRRLSEKPGMITPGRAASIAEDLQKVAIEELNKELQRQKDKHNG